MPGKCKKIKPHVIRQPEKKKKTLSNEWVPGKPQVSRASLSSTPSVCCWKNPSWEVGTQGTMWCYETASRLLSPELTSPIYVLALRPWENIFSSLCPNFLTRKTRIVVSWHTLHGYEDRIKEWVKVIYELSSSGPDSGLKSWSWET